MGFDIDEDEWSADACEAWIEGVLDEVKEPNEDYALHSF